MPLAVSRPAVTSVLGQCVGRGSPFGKFLRQTGFPAQPVRRRSRSRRRDLDHGQQLPRQVWLLWRVPRRLSAPPPGAVPRQATPLHLFSGKVDLVALPGDTVDINAELAPTYVDDAQRLEGVPLDQYDLVLADPPYSVEDAERYRTSIVKRNVVMRALQRVRRGRSSCGSIRYSHSTARPRS
jgi:hypothetical protein